MLDRKYILDNAELVKQNCLNRGASADVDKLVELETNRRDKLQEVQEWNRQANDAAKQIGKEKDAEKRQGRITAARELNNKNTTIWIRRFATYNPAFPTCRTPTLRSAKMTKRI